jgi:hypothetical protein
MRWGRANPVRGGAPAPPQRRSSPAPPFTLPLLRRRVLAPVLAVAWSPPASQCPPNIPLQAESLSPRGRACHPRRLLGASAAPSRQRAAPPAPVAYETLFRLGPATVNGSDSLCAWPPLKTHRFSIRAAAVAWFVEHRGPFAPHAFDASYSALRESVGLRRRVQSYLWAPQPPFRLNHLFLAIDGSPARENDWDRLVDAHIELVRYFDRAQEVPAFSSNDIDRVRRSFHVILSPEGADGPPLERAAAEWTRGS